MRCTLQVVVCATVVLTLAGCKRAAAPAEAPPAAGLPSAAEAAPGGLAPPRVSPEPPPPHEPAPPSRPPVRAIVTETVGDYLVVRLPLRGFERLTLGEKQTAFHLAEAALAGRDISWDQVHPLGLALRHTLDQVLDHAGGIPADLRKRIERYARAVWIGGGPYDRRTGRKLAPPLAPDDWAAVRAAAANAGAVFGEDIEAVERLILDPEVDPVLVARQPPPGSDRLQASACNLYDGVTMAALEGFEERYPLNSRLVQRDGRLTEEVYRVGRAPGPGERPAPAGRYAGLLQRVNEGLRRAIGTAGPAQQRTLSHLVDHFETGSLEDFDQAAVAWLQDGPRVDQVFGFVETTLDPRGVKGEWQGVVMMVDAPVAALMRGVAESAQELEQRAPWDARFRRDEVSVKPPHAMQIIAAHGGAGPAIPAGFDLPNQDPVRAKHGARLILLTNVLRAVDAVMDEAAIAALAPPAERAVARTHAARISELMLALHEVTGHHSGRLADDKRDHDPAEFLREHTTTIEEARADLVALHFIWDDRIRELAPECDDACRIEAYRRYARHDLAMLAQVTGDRIEDHHQRAVHLVVGALRDRGAVVRETIDGRTTQRVPDPAAMRVAVAELLAELTRIRGEGDYNAARTLVERFGAPIDPTVRAEITRRLEGYPLARAYAFVLPELEGVRDGDGAITDVRVSWPESFDAQTRAFNRASPERLRASAAGE